MPLDLTDDLRRAMQHPAFLADLARHLKPVLLEALAESQADAWLSAGAAAAYVYGRDDRKNAFRALVQRQPDLAAMAVGVGKLRRWKRSDLDQWLSSTEGLRRG